MKKLSTAIVTIFFVAFSSLILFYPADVAANSQWRLEKNEDNIQVFLRHTPGSAIKSFQGKVKIKASLSALVSILEDTNALRRVLHNTRNAKVLKRITPAKTINYIVTNMPWPVVDRDLIVLTDRTQNPANKRVVFTLTAQPKFSANVAGKVRIESMQGRWIFTPSNNGEVDVIYEMSIDPGGNIPKWVVNAMAVDLPFHTLKNLRAISKEAQYANAKASGIIE